MHSAIRIALIGCGRAAEVIYLPVLKKSNNVEVVAAIDPLKPRREFIANHFPNCTPLGEIHTEILDHIDAGIILTSPQFHIPIAKQLLKNNKFALVEKPLSLHLDGIDELLDIETISAGKLMMGFNHRYWKPVFDLKEQLKTRKTDILSFQVILTANPSKWQAIEGQSNVLDDLGPHLFDLARFISGREIISVRARRIHNNDYNLLLKMEGDMYIIGRVAYQEKTSKTIQIDTQQDKYYVNIQSERIGPLHGTKRMISDYLDILQRKIRGSQSSLKSSYKVQLENFLHLVNGRHLTYAGIRDGIQAVRTGLAAHHSVERNGIEILL